MARKELHHDRHTVSVLTDHEVITPKCHGKILVGDVALAVEEVIRKTCKEMKIEIIDMAVSVDQVHLFIKYPPKYSVSVITKKIKGRSSKNNRQHFPQSRGNGATTIYGLLDVIMATVRSWMGSCGEIYRDARNLCAER